MIEILRNILNGGVAKDAGGGLPAQQLAVVALLVEAAKLDGAFGDDERLRIGQLLRARFGRDEAGASALIAAADEQTARGGDLYGPTKTVRDNFDHGQRIEIVEMLWEVAYADGHLHDFEANLLRRVAGLIYVTDRESGEARKRVLGRRPAGAGTTGGTVK